MSDPAFDQNVAHRWFAVEFNNQAWELVESPARTADDTERMLSLSHAARVHWQSAGDALNHQRAECLLATAYVAAGMPEPAQRHASRCLEWVATNEGTQSPFDRAAAYGCAARAADLAGDHAAALRHYDQVLKSLSAFDEPAERDLIGQLYPAPQPR